MQQISRKTAGSGADIMSAEVEGVLLINVCLVFMGMKTKSISV